MKEKLRALRFKIYVYLYTWMNTSPHGPEGQPGRHVGTYVHWFYVSGKATPVWVTKRGEKSCWVRLPDGNTIKRKISRDLAFVTIRQGLFKVVVHAS